MLGKSVRLLVVLGASVGIPYAWFNDGVAPTMKNKVREWISGAKQTDSSFDQSLLTDTTRNSFRQETLPGINFATPEMDSELAGGVGDLSQVLQFNITPSWIMERWSRVSTVHTETGLEGFRVALVTGTKLEDVTGSLTYYFDAQQQLRRITLKGLTGDDRQLVHHVSQQFNLRSEPALGAGTHVARWNGKPTSLLRITHAPVLRSKRPHERLEIMLELNRPSIGHAMSAQAQAKLQSVGLTQRW